MSFPTISCKKNVLSLPVDNAGLEETGKIEVEMAIL